MKTNDTVQLDKSVYNSLSEIDQLIIDKHISPKKEYIIERIELEDNLYFLYLEGIINIGFNSMWFNKTN